nr:alanine racemase [Alteromonas sediminis]
MDVTALRNNFVSLSDYLSCGQIMPVVKANGYGHGAVAVAKALPSAAQFAVAIVEEALELRAAGVTQPIVILEGAFCKAGFEACYEGGFIPVIHCIEQIIEYQRLDASMRPPCWMKIDVGMHRLGFMSDDIPTAWQTLCTLHPVKPVLCGHFSDADDADCPVTPSQMTQFLDWQRQFQCQASLANSPAITFWPQSHVEWNRAGIALYGVAPNIDVAKPKGLSPVMTLQAPVISLRKIKTGESVGYGGTWQAQKPSCIATLAIGYADGYPRHAPSGTPVLINGVECPLAGRVSMDMISVDVTALTTIKIGDKAELWGKQLAVETIAKHCSTIGYELVTRVGPRVPRIMTTNK